MVDDTKELGERAGEWPRVTVPDGYVLPAEFYLIDGYIKKVGTVEPVLHLHFEPGRVVIEDSELEDLLLWVWGAYLAQREIEDWEFETIIGSSRVELDGAVNSLLAQIPWSGADIEGSIEN